MVALEVEAIVAIDKKAIPVLFNTRIGGTI